MYQDMYDFLIDYLKTHGGVSDEISNSIDPNDTTEEKLRTLIGWLCLPENGGEEMVRGILGLEFDQGFVDELVFDCFDIFF